jgi:hypothetical protein
VAVCVKGLEEKTDYPDYRVVVMDNGSTEPDALALLSDLRRTPRLARSFTPDQPTPVFAKRTQRSPRPYIDRVGVRIANGVSQ